VHVAAGDVNGDGRADVITGLGEGGSPDIMVFSGADGSVLRTIRAGDPTFQGGVFVAGGDVNGDGKADIIAALGPGSSPVVQGFSGADGSPLGTIALDLTGFTGGVRVATADVNRDGLADIIAVGGPQVSVFNGQALLASGQTPTAIDIFFAGLDDPFVGGGTNSLRRGA
jgi:serralysin